MQSGDSAADGWGCTVAAEEISGGGTAGAVSRWPPVHRTGQEYPSFLRLAWWMEAGLPEEAAVSDTGRANKPTVLDLFRKP